MLIPNTSPLVLIDSDAELIEKHLSGRHDQGSHAGGMDGMPRVHDMPAALGRNPEAIKMAIEIRAEARKADKAVTTNMLMIEKATGGKLVGLAHRIKSTESLARKIEQDAIETTQGDLAKAAEEVSDANRFTLSFDEANYTEGAKRTLELLEKQGYEVRAKNFWQQGDDYQGMNIKIRKGNGREIELQIHTPTSFKTKEEDSHPLYKRYREAKGYDARLTAWNAMVALADSVPLPDNYDQLLAIPNLVMHTFNG